MTNVSVLSLFAAREDISTGKLVESFEREIESAMEKPGRKKMRLKAVAYADALLILDEISKLEKKNPKLDRLEIVELYSN